MRKYYIFIIKEDFRQIYRKNSKTLYKILESLYYTKENEFKYGLSVYEQLCSTINVNILNKYFKDKFNCYVGNRHVFVREKVILEVNSSCIIIWSRFNMSSIFKYLLYYNRFLFVCDFCNEDFFWLEKEYYRNK